MVHFYENIGENWFFHQSLYTEMVNRFPSGSHFVEVGVWKGRGVAYMGVEIINSGKDIKLDCVDTFLGSSEHIDPNSPFYQSQLSDPHWLYNEFIRNTQPIAHIIKPIISFSWDAANLYENESLDFVFIDAAHDYESVLKDIKAWYPKIKNGGVIAGHDWAFPDVQKAVYEFFGGKPIRDVDNCWVFEKNDELVLFRDGKYEGWVSKQDNLWWLQLDVPHSFEIYNLDKFYSEEYFVHDHVPEFVVENYYNYITKIYEQITHQKLKTLLEIGSAGGWFTKKFYDNNIDVVGVEGSTCGIEACIKRGLPDYILLKHDVRKPLNLEKKFDMVCCTEVAEHLEIPFASTLINTLTSHSDLIWFSSAPPYELQMPTSYHHPNEQPDIFWINLFEFYGYDYYKLPDFVCNNTQLRGRYLFYNKNVYNFKNFIFDGY